MAKPVVVFDSVWKKFRRGERNDSLRDLLPSLVRRLTGKAKAHEAAADEFWAVRDISFEVQKGEALGIIGPNGAGKSTTLKLLTRILRPTRGHASVHGRVGALIEVSAGFHADLTGRENVFLQGAVMGMKRSDITTRLEAIIEFAGIGQFIDTPVKRYSSGMQARLGFSVAAHLEPDVLFVDEVLSVGDMSFQAKCLERMRQNVAAGVTLIFVSHNLQAVAALCKRTLVCAKGELLFDGPTGDGFTRYLDAAQTASTRYGTVHPTFRLRKSVLEWESLPLGADVVPHTNGALLVELECLADAVDFNVGVELERTRDLFYCYGVTTEELRGELYSCKAGDILRLRFEFCAHLARGHYRLNVNVRQPRAATFLLVSESAAQFSVIEYYSYDGVADISPHIEVRFDHEQSIDPALAGA